MKKIMITGGAGFIGSSLADQLVNEGLMVTAVDNFNAVYDISLKRRNILNLLNSDLFRLYELDITNKRRLETLFAKEKPDTIVHVAGLTRAGNNINTPYDFFSNNVTGTLNVLECARLYGARQLIHISTASVYGDTPFSSREEDTLVQPLHPYAASKWMSEQLCRQYARTDPFKIIILRLSTVYGPRQRPTMAIAQFVSRILKEEKIIMYGNGEATRDYLYIGDCVRAIRLALDHTSRFDIFNISGPEKISIHQTLETLSEFLDKPVRVDKSESPAGIPGHSMSDTGKAREKLGFIPLTNFKTGIQQYINWYHEPPRLTQKDQLP
jgi:UDP-glucuronate 4-epimerase